MKVFLQEDNVTLFHGNALSVLRSLPDESVNCCITSPPYWGLRSYGTDPQVWGGSDDCAHEWTDTSYKDSRKTDTTAGSKQRTNAGATGWRDALRQNATCSLCGAWSGEIGLEQSPEMFIEHLAMVFREVKRVLRADGTLWLNMGDSYAANRGHQVPDGKFKDVGNSNGSKIPTGYKPKDLIGIPWMLAFALRADGWYLRSDIIWAKPAPMPESVQDRPTRSHEYIFLLSKSERYFYGCEAIKEPSVSDHPSGNGYKREARLSYSGDNGARGSEEQWKPKGKGGKNAFRGQGHFRESDAGPANRDGRDMRDVGAGDTRNKRDVWTVNTEPFPDAHFAVFPPALITPCVLAGCPVNGVVLDPFSGAGTTMLVAKENGRSAIGIELQEDYLKIEARRLRQGVMPFAGSISV